MNKECQGTLIRVNRVFVIVTSVSNKCMVAKVAIAAKTWITQRVDRSKFISEFEQEILAREAAFRRTQY